MHKVWALKFGSQLIAATKCTLKASSDEILKRKNLLSFSDLFL